MVDTHDICSTHGTIKSQSGYIATPNYPNNYPADRDCVVNIEVQEHQRITLTILDMDLESNMSIQCLDWMYTMDGKRSVTLCGRRGNEPIKMLSNLLLLKFKSNGIENHKGFWLYFEGMFILDVCTVWYYNVILYRILHTDVHRQAIWCNIFSHILIPVYTFVQSDTFSAHLSAKTTHFPASTSLYLY